MEDLSDSPIVWDNEWDDGDNQNEKWIIKHHIMFVIDASKPMFNTLNDKTFFSTSIDICKNIVIQLIRKNRNDKIGFMLFGTMDDNKTCPNYIRVITEPKKPSIELIKVLEDLYQTTETRFGQSPLTPLADTLWYSNYLIRKYNEKQCYNTIILITCNDKPIVGDSKKQFNLRKRLDDIIKNDIDFKLIPIGSTFNMNIFYNDILSNLNDIDKPTYGLENMVDIMSEINKKIKHSRSLSKINFFIDNDNCISMSLFNFYTKCKIPSKVKLDKRNNKQLTTSNKVYSLDSNELLYKSDLVKYIIIAQTKILFKHEDLSILKSSIINPGIRLLGFTNKKNIRISYHFKTSTFIRPNETIKGSSVFFNAMLESCLKMNKVIMSYIKVRQGGRVHLAALIPQNEILDENGIQKYPAGFHCIYLPFLECVRSIKQHISIDKLPKITGEMLSCAKSICENMYIEYYPTLIKNPKINFHWAMLEAMALESEEIPTTSDETLPQHFSVDSNLGVIKDDIIKYLLPTDYNLPAVTAVPNKRVFSCSSKYKKVVKQKKIN